MEDAAKISMYGTCANCGAPREIAMVVTVVAGIKRTHTELICSKGCEAEDDEWDHDEHYGRTHGP